jgi:hypothetical protein
VNRKPLGVFVGDGRREGLKLIRARPSRRLMRTS